ncbi:MAG: DUF1987 domain-containing protein [Salinivirgaceae bacterium]|nr:DUF1987 domain-containing protein [Salinivirgaceae bacterium]
MENYISNGSELLPKFCFDKEKNLFSISGRSIPENAIDVYSPIIEWWQQYIQNPNPETIIEMNFEYINSSSMKQIAKLVALLDTVPANKSAVKVRWHYNIDDTDSKQQAERLAKMVKFPISLIADANK